MNLFKELFCKKHEYSYKGLGEYPDVKQNKPNKVMVYCDLFECIHCGKEKKKNICEIVIPV